MQFVFALVVIAALITPLHNSLAQSGNNTNPPPPTPEPPPDPGPEPEPEPEPEQPGTNPQPATNQPNQPPSSPPEPAPPPVIEEQVYDPVNTKKDEGKSVVFERKKKLKQASKKKVILKTLDGYVTLNYAELERPDINGVAGFKTLKHGISVGMDTLFSRHFGAGMFLNYTSADRELNVGGDETQRGVGIGLYGIYLQENYDVSVFVRYGKQDKRIERSTSIDDFVSASPKGDQVNGGLNASYFYTFPNALVTTFSTGLEFSRSTVDSYDETGSLAALRYPKVTRNSSEGSLGLALSRPFGISIGVINPRLGFNWTHRFDRDEETIETMLISDNSRNFGRPRVELDREYYTVSVGSSLVLPRGWSGFISFSYDTGRSDLKKKSVTLGLRKEFLNRFNDL